ncbi:hypothetical protein [Paraglaciecola sp. MB-3u-78]|uniref:TOTE conflict system archaeo-eukaryotic primase domain-containing protein n=1 Tax=Paraglaciecola sp. MB-3u-78 TaxID=2058332 RepID=UPI000C33860D|nr:hypothetical protein [Paraglaciecola sp. MB-3u-78]PKG99975.1 hypothetical protein CXF95_04800 [Paraglaciecola sp. MB-3u-78]
MKGFKTIGIYPLLTDNSTYLLAADFDKEDWFEATSAFATTCESLNIPYLLERSISGNGGHIWIFFSQAEAASDARRLGNGLLRKTMERYPLLSFYCFNRLFPNQDIMPEGGFGNLIALPLQLEPRKNNNSIFINNEGIPYNDKWSILAATRKVTKSQLQSTLNQLNTYIEIAPEYSDKRFAGSQLEKIKFTGKLKSQQKKAVDAKYIHGFTATPKRQDGLEKLMHFQIGSVVYKAATTISSFDQHVEA